MNILYQLSFAYIFFRVSMFITKCFDPNVNKSIFPNRGYLVLFLPISIIAFPVGAYFLFSRWFALILFAILLSAQCVDPVAEAFSMSQFQKKHNMQMLTVSLIAYILAGILFIHDMFF